MDNSKTKGAGLVTILLLITALGRMFLSYEEENKKKKDALLMLQIGNRARVNKVKATIVIDSLLKAQGHIFLYTNDAHSKMAWVPDIAGSSMGGVTSIISESANYQKFVEKYDSSGFILLLSHDDKFLYPLNRNIVLNDGRAKKRLYFMGYDSKGKILKDTAGKKQHPGLSEQNFVTTWGVGYTDMSQLTTDSLENFFSFACTQLLKETDGFYFYMAGVEKDNDHPGTDSAGFMRSVAVLNKSLRNSGIDTGQFHFKVFARGDQ